MQSQERASESIDFEMEKLQQFGDRLTAKLKENAALLKDVKDNLDQVKKLEHLVEYLKIVQDIQDIK